MKHKPWITDITIDIRRDKKHWFGVSSLLKYKCSKT